MGDITVKNGIKKKFILSYILVGAFALIVGILGLMILGFSDETNSEVLEYYAFAQADVQKLISDINKEGNAVRDMIFLEDPQELSNAESELNELNNLVDQDMKTIYNKLVGNTEQEYFNSISSNLESYHKAREEVISLGKQNRNAEALEYYRTNAEAYKNSIQQDANRLLSEKVNQGNDKITYLTANQNLARVLIISVIILCFLGSIGIGIIISKKIGTPIKNILDATLQISEGNLNIDISIPKERDEIRVLAIATSRFIMGLKEIIADISYHLGEISKGNLSEEVTRQYKGDFIQIEESLKKILGSLNDTLSQIHSSSEQVSMGATQVSQVSQSLSNGASEQELEIEALRDLTKKITIKAKNNADAAGQIDTATKIASNHMTECSIKMDNMLASIEHINQTSEQIEKIIKTIDDIAFQTNILALNAAVEAARAGSAGKGFAVVADEVRNLASKSAEAAKSTTQLIQSTVQSVSDGSVIAAETAEALKTAVDETKNVVDMTGIVTNVSLEQAELLKDVSERVEHISSVVLTNTAAAEEGAATSEELSGQANVLEELIAIFRLKQGA